MSREFAEALRDHKQALFEAFQELIPFLAESFPECRVVVRPHPTEKHDVYREIAARHDNITVTNEGNVVPWLMAARALVHNGCTTGVEAFALDVPAVSFRPHIDERIDQGFYSLPNGVSHQCFDLEEVRVALGDVLAGRRGAFDGPEARALFERCVAGLNGRMASARIVDVVDEIAAGAAETRPAGPWNRIQRGAISLGLKVVRRFRSHLPGDHHKPEFQRHRFPGSSLDQMRARVARWQGVLDDPVPLTTVQIAENIFRITN